jgi:hypothetical protein
MSTTSYEPLKHHLQDWVDIDVAQFHLARCLGILGPEYSHLIAAKPILWSNNPTGNLLYQLLRNLENARFVEIDHEDLKVRWSPTAPSV